MLINLLQEKKGEKKSTLKVIAIEFLLLPFYCKKNKKTQFSKLMN